MVNNSDKTFFIQLIIWTTANGISAVSVWALLFVILRSPKVRSNSFNLYLVFCLVPDAYKNLAGFSANLANLLMDSGSPNACRVIGWNDAYWWCASLWMSFATFVQIHKMLIANNRTRRYNPPTLKRVTMDSAMIHVFSILMATLTVLPAGIFPRATPDSGCEAYPGPGNRAQLIFYWTFFMPLTALIPTLLVTLLCSLIWWKQLIALQNAKYRALLFYFARLLAIIYIVTIAVIVSFFFTNWVQAIAFTIFNLIVFFQACFALKKKDIQNAFLDTWCCRRCDNTSSTTRRSSSNGKGASQISVTERKEVGSGEDLDIEVPNETATNEADEAIEPTNRINSCHGC
ncbi:hypothetical protein ACHAXA_008044 [Cyclostephanos tholiformis]|uniref:G-protein coupled receptors family 2 profile 2 domain-containing protein n=1 Tax=Cyclostephanos tholiformis TaxID=382380 RepID=A0ABD3RTY5_9STRA